MFFLFKEYYYLLKPWNVYQCQYNIYIRAYKVDSDMKKTLSFSSKGIVNVNKNKIALF